MKRGYVVLKQVTIDSYWSEDGFAVIDYDIAARSPQQAKLFARRLHDLDRDAALVAIPSGYWNA